MNSDGPRFATDWMPFLVGLYVNKEGTNVSADGILPDGTITMPYVYPIPPLAETDTPLGYVYFLLYEQDYTLNAVDTRPFSHPSNCNAHLTGR